MAIVDRSHFFNYINEVDNTTIENNLFNLDPILQKQNSRYSLLDHCSTAAVAVFFLTVVAAVVAPPLLTHYTIIILSGSGSLLGYFLLTKAKEKLFLADVRNIRMDLHREGWDLRLNGKRYQNTDAYVQAVQQLPISPQKKFLLIKLAHQGVFVPTLAACLDLITLAEKLAPLGPEIPYVPPSPSDRLVSITANNNETIISTSCKLPLKCVVKGDPKDLFHFYVDTHIDLNQNGKLVIKRKLMK